MNTLGYRAGTRQLELMAWRAEGTSKTPKREIKLLSALIYIQTQVWKAVFGKPADGIEKSVDKPDECRETCFCSNVYADHSLDMIVDNDPLIERHISVPRDMSQLSCSSFTAGIVEAVLDGMGLVSCAFAISYINLNTPRCAARASHSAQHTESPLSVPNNHPHQTRTFSVRTRRAFERLNSQYIFPVLTVITLSGGLSS